MRPTLRVTLAAALLALAASAIWAAAWAAEAVQSTRFDVTVVRKEGAALSGLAEDASGLIVSDLAAGRLYRFADGVFAPFGPELPHGLDVIGDPTGPYRIMPTADGYVVAQGWTPTDADEGPLDHAILEIAEGGAARVVSSDFWNPFDVMIDGDGMLVVDAGRNALTRLSRSGEGQTIATFPRLEQAGASMQGLSPTEFPKSERYAVDAVPTAVAASGGRLFVTQLGGIT
jgi:hypothetical protein